MNFSGKFGRRAFTIWYPASGCRLRNDGYLSNVGYDGCYWSASPWSASPYSDNSYYAYYLPFNNGGDVGPSNGSNRAYGFSVRCLQESK